MYVTENEDVRTVTGKAGCVNLEGMCLSPHSSGVQEKGEKLRLHLLTILFKSHSMYAHFCVLLHI